MKPEDRIYNAYFVQKGEKMYYNQIKETTMLSHSSLQNTLARMSRQGILKTEKTRQNVYYSISDKKIIAIKFSEIAIRKFNSLNIGVKSPLRTFLKDLPISIYTIVLFGSASTGDQNQNSDIDLLIVYYKKTDLDKRRKEAEITSKYPLSLFYCSAEQFIRSNDDIIIQAKKTGFPIHKEQNFYEAIIE
ncbi:MAG: nucleotidyltransferase domain-containing protein [Candidatus Woesearchaeota archaeon]